MQLRRRIQWNCCSAGAGDACLRHFLVQMNLWDAYRTLPVTATDKSLLGVFTVNLV